MAQLVVGLAGAAIGSTFGAPGIGWAIGASIGGMVGPTQKSQGPRLTDLKVTAAELGAAVPYIIGYPRGAGYIAWASDKREIATTTRQGKGGPSAESTNYTYEVDLLILLSANLIAGVRRIWSSGKLVYSVAAQSGSDTIDASEDATTWRAMRVYTGADDQLPDPTYEAAVGAGNAPAYRGRGTIMLEGVQLGSGGQLPNLTFEIAQRAEFSPSEMATASRLGVFTPGAACCPVVEDGGIIIFEMSAYSVDWPATLTISRLTPDGAKQLYFGEFAYRYYPVLGWSDVPGMLIVRRTGGAPLPGYAFIDEGGIEQTYLAPYTADGQFLGYWYRWADRMAMRGNSESGFLQGMVRLWHTGTATLIASRDFGANVTAVVVGASYVLVQVAGVVHECHRNTLETLHVRELPAAWTQQQASTTADGAIEMVTDTGVYAYAEGRLALKYPGNFSASNFDSRPARRDGNRLTLIEPLTGAPVTIRMREIFLAAITPDAIPLGEVVSDLCQACGVGPEDIDVTALAGQLVHAMAVQPTSARAVLEQLATAYYFECVESDKLYFRRRGAAPVATIPYGDYGADGLLTLQDANDLELPAQVNVSYLNLSNAYQQGNEVSDRITTESTAVSSVQLGMGLTPAVAKAIADTAVLDQTVAARAGSVALDVRYARLEPTDVVLLQDSAGLQHRARIVKIADADGVRSLDLVADDARVLRELGITSDDYDDDYTVMPLADTDLVILDIPILRDQDDNAGLYAAGDGLRGRWPGYLLLRDGTEVGRSATGAAMGVVAEALGNWAGLLVDEAHIITVTVNPGDELVSITHADLSTSTANYAAIGAPGRWEIVQYQRAALVSDGVYRVSGLARGRLGTEHLRSTHQAGDRFVVLDGAGLLRDVGNVGDLGTQRTYMAVTQGARIDDGTTVTATPTWQGLRPLAPVGARQLKQGNGDIVLQWGRRSRYVSNVFMGVLPLGEASEAYEVEILNGALVRRTLTSNTPAVTYTQAQQVADFGSEQATVSARIYQLSASIGRGQPASL